MRIEHKQSELSCNLLRRGTVMIVCVFVEAMISLMVLAILDSLRIQASTVSAIETHEQCLYLAEAGVEHATSFLEADPAFRGKFEWTDKKSVLSTGGDVRRYAVTVSHKTDGSALIVSQGRYRGHTTTRRVETISEKP